LTIELHLSTIGSIITLILASAATTSIVYGQIIFPIEQNATTNPTSPPSHAPPTLVPTIQASTTRSNAPSTPSLTQQPKPHMIEIVSPSKGEQVLLGKDLVTTVSGKATKVYEINLKVRYAHSISMPTSTNNKERQIKVIVNYTAAASTPTINKTINAVMKVYPSNGTLIKTSSFPNGFVVKHSGTAQLATAIKDNRIQQLTAVVQFMTKDKLQPLSNSVMVKLAFGQKMDNKV
jgi:hypothetical protein